MRYILGHRDGENTKHGIEGTHGPKVELRGVLLARLELERSIVTSDITREANKQLAERRVDIKVVRLLEVV